MRAKTLIELLTLSTNLYMISKDQAFLDNLSEMTKKGKEKFNDLVDNFTDEKGDSEEALLDKFLEKVKAAREELNEKMEKVAHKVYAKMHIAHTEEVQKLLSRIELLEKQLNLMEAELARSTKQGS